MPGTQITVEPRFNEVAGDRPNLFVKWRVRYIEILFHTFYCNFGRDIEIISFVISRTSLNRGSLNRGSTVVENIHAQGQQNGGETWKPRSLSGSAEASFALGRFRAHVSLTAVQQTRMHQASNVENSAHCKENVFITEL